MDNDDFNQIPGNISSIIDLLEDKGISWSQYQQVRNARARIAHFNSHHGSRVATDVCHKCVVKVPLLYEKHAKYLICRICPTPASRARPG